MYQSPEQLVWKYEAIKASGRCHKFLSYLGSRDTDIGWTKAHSEAFFYIIQEAIYSRAQEVSVEARCLLNTITCRHPGIINNFRIRAMVRMVARHPDIRTQQIVTHCIMRGIEKNSALIYVALDAIEREEKPHRDICRQYTLVRFKEILLEQALETKSPPYSYSLAGNFLSFLKLALLKYVP